MHSEIDSENNLTATTNLNRHIDRTHSVPVCQMSIPYYTSTHSMAVPCYTDDLYMNSILFGQATTNELHDYEQRECVKCGTVISAQYIHWSQDESGFNLCDQCQMSSIAQREQITFANHCANCCTRKTTLWRRNSSGDSVCNACGLYYKLHGVNRPWSLKKDGIQTRKRKSKKDQSSTQNEITFSNKNSKQSSLNIADTSSYTFEYHEHCNRASPQLNYSPIRTSESLHPHCSSSSFKQHPSQWNHQGSSSPFYQNHSVVCHQVKDETPHSWNRYMNYGV